MSPDSESPRGRPTLYGRFVVFTFWLAKWIARIALVLLIIAIGQVLPVLHRLDAALDAHKPVLMVVLGTLLFIGFAMFMGGILKMLVESGSGREARGQVSFRELKTSLRTGHWRRDTKMRKFLFILVGVLIGTAAGAAMGIVFGDPGLKLLFILSFGYAAVMIARGFYRA